MQKMIERVKENRTMFPFLAPYRTTKNYWIHKRMLNCEDIPLPRDIAFEVTQRCNLNCTMCFYRLNKAEYKYKELSLEEIKFIFEQRVKKFNFRNCYLTGSEMFVRTDIKEIFEIIASQGIAITGQTNGTLLTEERNNFLAVFKNKIKSYGASINGLNATDNRIRRGKDTFKRTIEGIKFLHKTGITTTVNIIVMEENLREIVELVDLLSTTGTDEILLQLIVIHKESEAEESRAILGCRGEAPERSSSPLHTVIVPELEFVSSASTVDKILTKAVAVGREKGTKVTRTPLVAASHFNDVFYKRVRDKLLLSCGCFYALRIAPDGSVIHCPYIRKKFGNLLDTPLPDIWNSMEFKKFRKDLLLANMLPTCVRCGRLRYRNQYM